MNKGCLLLGKIQIKHSLNHCLLTAEVNDNGTMKVLSYGVDSKYDEYLTWERSDAFLVALLYYAMFNGYDIHWKVPCDEKLIYQLETYFIPVYACEFPFMHLIHLIGPVINENLTSSDGVATGVSNGVDSCYTICNYLNSKYPDKRLTHLVFTNWFITDSSKEKQNDFMKKYQQKLPQQAEHLGLSLVFVDFQLDKQFSIGQTNDPERGVIQDAGFNTLKYCSVALALQKLFGTYYFSDGFSASEFSFKENDVAYHDLFTLPMISSSVQFYSAGSEVTRMGKVEKIADWDYAQQNLQVCFMDHDINCGRCEKCIRTMFELYLCDKLELYRNRFPVDDFKKHITVRFAQILVQVYKGHVFEKEIISEMKKRGKRIPFCAYLLFPIFALFEWLRLHLRQVKTARYIYRKLGLDIRLYGRKTYSKQLDGEILEKHNAGKI